MEGRTTSSTSPPPPPLNLLTKRRRLSDALGQFPLRASSSLPGQGSGNWNVHHYYVCHHYHDDEGKDGRTKTGVECGEERGEERGSGISQGRDLGLVSDTPDSDRHCHHRRHHHHRHHRHRHAQQQQQEQQQDQQSPSHSHSPHTAGTPPYPDQDPHSTSRYNVMLIGLSGDKNAGKTGVAKALAKRFGFQILRIEKKKERENGEGKGEGRREEGLGWPSETVTTLNTRTTTKSTITGTPASTQPPPAPPPQPPFPMHKTNGNGHRIDSFRQVTLSPGYPLLIFPDEASLIAYVTPNWNHPFVIDDISTRDQVVRLSKRPFFLHAHVIANPVVRCARQTTEKRISLEAFLKRSRTKDGLWLEVHADFLFVNEGEDGISFPEDFLQSVKERLRPSWDSYFMHLCELASLRSNCMKRRVGCLLVQDNRIIATGYNGTPRGIRNCNQGGCRRCNTGMTPADTCLCIHAEENALLEAGRSRSIVFPPPPPPPFLGADSPASAAATGGAASGIGSGGGVGYAPNVLYCNTCPCLGCAKKIIQYQIQRVVYRQDFRMGELTKALFGEAGVVLVQHTPSGLERRIMRVSGEEGIESVGNGEMGEVELGEEAGESVEQSSSSSSSSLSSSSVHARPPAAATDAEATQPPTPNGKVSSSSPTLPPPSPPP